MSVCIACLASINAHAASFDCTKASTWVEKSVCRDTELSVLDDKMARQYKARLSNVSSYDDLRAHQAAVRAQQRRWLRFRRDTCRSQECLIREYKEYIEAPYSGHISDAQLPKKQVFDTFYEDVNLTIYDLETDAFVEAGDATNIISVYAVHQKPSLAVIEGDLIFTNAHLCSIDTEVALWSENHWAIHDYATDASLRLYPVVDDQKTQLLLVDSDRKYQQSHCGMRGYFDGKVLESR